MARKCKPSKYATVSASGQLQHGWRCAACGIPSMKFDTRRLRTESMLEHKKKC